MAWYTKYRTEFKDILSLEWRVDIEEWATSQGDIINVTSTYNPLSIEYLSGNDSLLEVPVKGSTANVSIYSDTDFQFINLFSLETDFKYRVSIYYNTTSLYWRGYIFDDYQEPYDSTSYPVTISATDGLGTLRNIMYDDDGTPYTGRRSIAQIIIDVLSKIGATGDYTGFTEYVNVYENNIYKGITDSMFDQTYIDVTLFEDADCYTVLSEILKTFNAVIRHKNGTFIIYRPTEISQSIIYGRVFTSATTKIGISVTSGQLINRVNNATDIRSVDGGTLTIEEPARKVTINQDYGYKDSLINNWELKSSSYDPDTYSFDSWVCSNVSSINNHIPEEENGLWLTALSTRREGNYYASQTFGDYLIASSNVFGFSIDYYIYSYNGTALSNVYLDIRIKHVATGKYLEVKDAEDLQWSATEKYITINIATVANGRSGWINFARSLPDGLPGDGEIEIKIYNPYCATSFAFGAGFKNVKFFSTSDLVISKRKVKYYYPFWSQGLPIKLFRREKVFLTKYQDNPEIIQYDWVKVNTINGTELGYDMIIGDVVKSGTGGVYIDNIIEQFSGSLSISASLSILSNVVAEFITKYASDYLPGGVVVTQGTGVHTNDVIFTAATAGIDFTGNTTITNTSGNLSGTVVNTQADAALEAEWQPDFYYLVNNKCSNGGVNYICISAHSNQEPPDGAYWDLTDQPQARIDTITLSGSTGSANILCDGVTKSIGVIAGRHYPSAIWSTRGNTENVSILKLICDEIALQYSRPKQLLSLPILEDKSISNTPHINIMSNFKDTLNVDPTFDIRNLSVWEKTNCTLSLTSNNIVRYTSTDEDSHIKLLSDINIKGSDNYLLSIRYRIVSGDWLSGQIFYGTSSHTRSGSYQKNISLINDGKWHNALIDMSDLDTGGTDWVDSTITDIWFDLIDQDDIVIDLDYIGFARTFVLNSADFNVRDRAWSLDLIELI